MKKSILVVAASLVALSPAFLAGCAYPTETVTQGGQTSAIIFSGFPENANILINGRTVGETGDYDGTDQSLAVPTGTHNVVVTQGGRTLLEKRVYVGRNSTTTISPQ